jgi:hypothetical protein
MKSIFLAGYRDGNHWQVIGGFPSEAEAREALRTVNHGGEIVAVGGDVVECPLFADLDSYKQSLVPAVKDEEVSN